MLGIASQPADLRKKYGLKPGDAVNVIDYGGVLSLVPVLKDPVRESRGMFAGGAQLIEDLLEEHRCEVKADERKSEAHVRDAAG
jgi:bifunctional DNA-binding transcriptional regulator/antitoxin component of YhaV-PrlF toxin-antitoxin module